MPAIGITGGISTGKSTFVECLCDLLPVATFFAGDYDAELTFGTTKVKQSFHVDLA